MNKLGTAWTTCIALFAACATPGDRAPTPSNDRGGDVAQASPPIDRTASSPSAEPKHYLIETEIFELPLPLAEELYGRADERETTIGTLIDESKCREALELLAPSNSAIAHTRRADTELEIGKLELMLSRRPTSSSKKDVAAQFASRFASDYLALKVRLTRSQDWPPLLLETQIEWSDPAHRVLGRLSSATSPIPDGYWMQIVCLPSRQEAASAGTPALFVFMHVISHEAASRAGSNAR